jgi:hypothetical protein
LKVTCNGLKTMKGVSAGIRVAAGAAQLTRAGIAISNNEYDKALMLAGEGFMRLLGATADTFTAINTICFAAGTLVSTESGLRPIETIQRGERVWAYDLKAAEWSHQVVQQTFENKKSGRFVTAVIDGQEIVSTDGHPYWVVDGAELDQRPETKYSDEVRSSNQPGRWVQAAYLRQGDILLSRDGRNIAIAEVRFFEEEDFPVYNLSVAVIPNYAVGTCQVLVHNVPGKGLNGVDCGVTSGAKRGTKTDPNAPHNAKIRSEAEKLRSEGNEIVSGGGGDERLIRTPGGKKSGRRPDIEYRTPSGELRGRNIGKTKADGTPVTRELDALDDLNGPGGLPTDFVPYDK